MVSMAGVLQWTEPQLLCHEPRWAVCVCNTEGPGCLGVTVSWRKTCHGRGWRRKKREVQHCELKMGRRLTRRGLTLWILHKQKRSVRFLNKVHMHNAQWWLTWLLRAGRSQDLAVALLLWLKFPLLQGHTGNTEHLIYNFIKEQASYKCKKCDRQASAYSLRAWWWRLNRVFLAYCGCNSSLLL